MYKPELFISIFLRAGIYFTFFSISWNLIQGRDYDWYFSASWGRNEGPPETLKHSEHYCIEGLKGSS